MSKKNKEKEKHTIKLRVIIHNDMTEWYFRILEQDISITAKSISEGIHTLKGVLVEQARIDILRNKAALTTREGAPQPEWERYVRAYELRDTVSFGLDDEDIGVLLTLRIADTN